MKDTEISDDVRKITRSTTFLFGPIIGSAAGSSLQLAEYKDYVNKIEKNKIIYVKIQALKGGDNYGM